MMMKSTLRVLVVSLFAFQALLLVSTTTEAARCLPTPSLGRNNGRRPSPSPPPPPHYSPGPGQIQKLKTPPSTPTAYVSKRHHPPPPPSPKPAPGPIPMARDPKDLLYQNINSPPNPYAASA